MYRLSEPSERAEFDRKVEDWDAKCYQFTVDVADPPRVLTEEMLRGYLARFREHIEVYDEEYARQRFVDVFQISWEIEREYWEEDDRDPVHVTALAPITLPRLCVRLAR